MGNVVSYPNPRTENNLLDMEVMSFINWAHFPYKQEMLTKLVDSLNNGWQESMKLDLMLPYTDPNTGEFQRAGFGRLSELYPVKLTNIVFVLFGTGIRVNIYRDFVDEVTYRTFTQFFVTIEELGAVGDISRFGAYMEDDDRHGVSRSITMFEPHGLWEFIRSKIRILHDRIVDTRLIYKVMRASPDAGMHDDDDKPLVLSTLARFNDQITVLRRLTNQRFGTVTTTNLYDLFVAGLRDPRVPLELPTLVRLE